MGAGRPLDELLTLEVKRLWLSGYAVRAAGGAVALAGREPGIPTESGEATTATEAAVATATAVVYIGDPSGREDPDQAVGAAPDFYALCAAARAAVATRAATATVAAIATVAGCRSQPVPGQVVSDSPIFPPIPLPPLPPS